MSKYRSWLYAILKPWQRAPCIQWSLEGKYVHHSDCARFRVTQTHYDRFVFKDYQGFKNAPDLVFDNLDDPMQLAQVKKDADLTRRKF